MDADWITSPSARRVLQHDADPRPAWLWSQDGQHLLWQNEAAALFLAKIKKHGLKRSEPAVPIKGQVARIIRLGSSGRTSLSRVQFLAGDRPAFTTCACTPLLWQNDEPALLIVGVDPIDAEILEAAGERDEPEALVAEMEPPVAVEETVVVVTEEATAEMAEAAEPVQGDDGAVEMPVEADHGAVEPQPEEHDERSSDQDEPTAAEEPAVADTVAEEPPSDPIAAVIEADEQAYERELDNWRETEPEVAPEAVADDTQNIAEEPAQENSEPEPVEAEARPARGRLGALFDAMAENEALYTPLTAADDEPPKAAAAPLLYKVTGRGFLADSAPPVAEEEGEDDVADLARLDEVVEEDADEAVAEFVAEEPEAPEAEAETPAEIETAIEAEPEAVPPLPAEPASLDDVAEALTDIVKALEDAAPPAVDEEAVERVSRYNFDELSRILNERVGDRGPLARGNGTPDRQPRPGELVNLSGETLVLNRLPLGILVFRDQQVLFANRAITEMIGYESVEALRNAGLSAIFPAQDRDDQQAGPVNHLVQRDGTLVPVTARLQSISWQGRPALMLSASMTEVRTGHEDAVRAFAEMFAGARGDGFIEANRAGVIGAANARAAALLNQAERPLHGRALTTVVAAQDLAALRDFLERPARFAETARPAVSLRGTVAGSEIMLFAQGQAGVITGYFGLVHRSEASAPLQLPSAGGGEAEPALLARISRGVRRPLNTIVGFADLLRSDAFGALANERYERYAQDIGAAGQEIAALVDELDDYTRLRDGRYLPHRASIDLLSLLESCVVRIRPQASLARVIVRSAISEKLPKVTADRASLVQAVLNLLASAVDQTPTGGAVVISAQREEDGAIAVHVRDSSTNAVDMAERFVVFRDGIGRDGQVLTPVRSSVGLALTRSLLAVNAVSLSVDPAGNQGMLFSLLIPGDLVDKNEMPKAE